MADEKKFGATEVTDPEQFAALLNKQFAKYNDLLSGTAAKGDLRQLQADMIVENKDILSKVTTNGDEMQKMVKQLESFTDTIKIQGETITTLKTAFNPNPEAKSFRNKLTEGLQSEQFKAFANGDTTKAKFSIDTKDVAFTGTNGAGAVTQTPLAFQSPQLDPVEEFDVRLLLPTGTIGSSSLQYPYRSAETDAMTHESENSAANESTMAFTMGTAYATRISTFIEISRSALQNAPWLNQFVQNWLMQKFIEELNTECIAGAGSGAGMAGDNALKGLVEFANSYAGTNFDGKIANPNNFDVFNCVKGEMAGLYNIIANTYMVNPYTGTILTSSKDTISNFITPATFLQPNAQGYTGAFGMKQIESSDIVVDNFLVASINPSYMQLLFNGPIEILATDAHASNFISDLVTIKLEAKVMLPVYNANALMKGVLSTELAAISTGA